MVEGQQNLHWRRFEGLQGAPPGLFPGNISLAARPTAIAIGACCCCQPSAAVISLVVVPPLTLPARDGDRHTQTHKHTDIIGKTRRDDNNRRKGLRWVLRPHTDISILTTFSRPGRPQP